MDVHLDKHFVNAIRIKLKAEGWKAFMNATGISKGTISKIINQHKCINKIAIVAINYCMFNRRNMAVNTDQGNCYVCAVPCLTNDRRKGFLCSKCRAFQHRIKMKNLLQTSQIARDYKSYKDNVRNMMKRKIITKEAATTLVLINQITNKKRNLWIRKNKEKIMQQL